MSAEPPAIIQGGWTVLLEVDPPRYPRYEEGRDILSRFAELEHVEHELRDHRAGGGDVFAN